MCMHTKFHEICSIRSVLEEFKAVEKLDIIHFNLFLLITFIYPPINVYGQDLLTLLLNSLFLFVFLFYVSMRWTDFFSD